MRLGWGMSLLPGPCMWPSYLLDLLWSSRAGSPGAEGPPPVLLCSRSCAKPHVSAGKTARIAPIQLPQCAHIGWQPRAWPAHFCLDVCQGGVGMAT